MIDFEEPEDFGENQFGTAKWYGDVDSQILGSPAYLSDAPGWEFTYEYGLMEVQ